MQLTAVILACLMYQVSGHGRLKNPPSRASMWKYGFGNPQNYQDHQMNCGGYTHQANQGGKCGLCGDPFDKVRDHEAGGRYANGIITAFYRPGDILTASVEITANHYGWFEFRMCVNNDIDRRITQECLDENLLELADGSGTRYYLPTQFAGTFDVNLRLPAGVTCSQCVLQWKYNTGNSWGMDPDGRSCMGCGHQEQFYACSDIVIHPSVTTTPAPSTTTRITTPSGPVTICKGIGPWEGQEDKDRYCQANCLHTPPNCHKHCACEEIHP